jgi:FkbM family methyltransferase
VSADVPAVSVILPTRNRRQWLRHSIGSVLQQTFRDFELIVIDDASADGTAELVEGLGDSRVRYVRMDTRVGAARARNEGVRLGRGQLLAFQDSDDEWLPEKLERQVRLMQASAPDVGLIVGAFVLREGNRQREVRSAALERGADYDLDIIQGVPLVTPLWLVRRTALEAAGLFDTTLASSEDYELAFRLSRVCRFRAVPDIVLVKNGHAASLSADNRLLLKGLETVYARYSAFWVPYPHEELSLLSRISTLQLRAGYRRAAVHTLLRALARHPWRPFLLRRLASALFGRGAARAYAARVARWLRPNRLRGPRVMEAFGRNFPHATFVQIGSNDGDKHDPLRRTLLRRHWTGVMVEPVPYVFARLQRNYGSVPGIALENAAITATANVSSLPFHYVAEAHQGEGLPDWYDELGSFRKEVVMSHADRVPGLAQRLVTTEVPCITLEALCRRHGLGTVDLVHMDTEGYDGELIAAMDLSRLRPILLIYEHKHLPEPQRSATRTRLQREGYTLFEEGADTWCADLRERSAGHRMFLRAWRRITAGVDHAESIHS